MHPFTLAHRLLVIKPAAWFAPAAMSRQVMDYTNELQILYKSVKREVRQTFTAAAAAAAVISLHSIRGCSGAAANLKDMIVLTSGTVDITETVPCTMA